MSVQVRQEAVSRGLSARAFRDGPSAPSCWLSGLERFSFPVTPTEESGASAGLKSPTAKHLGSLANSEVQGSVNLKATSSLVCGERLAEGRATVSDRRRSDFQRYEIARYLAATTCSLVRGQIFLTMFQVFCGSSRIRRQEGKRQDRNWAHRARGRPFFRGIGHQVPGVGHRRFAVLALPPSSAL
jgi:hypothetical protein